MESLKEHKIKLSVVILSILAFTLWFAISSTEYGANTPVRVTGTSSIDGKINEIFAANRKKTHEIKEYIEGQDDIFLAELGKLHPKEGIDQEKDAYKKLAKAFKRMHAMGNYFNAMALQSKELAELVSDELNVDIAKSILLDFNEAEKEFEEDQAIARVYALKMLAEASREGDAQILYDVSSQLSEQLSDVLDSGEVIKNARGADLRELLHILVDRKELGDFEDTNLLITFLYDAGYQKGMNEEIADYFDNAVFFPLLNQYGRKRASELVGNALGYLNNG